MSVQLDRPSRFTQFALPSAFLGALTFLVAVAFGESDFIADATELGLAIGLFLPPLAGLAAILFVLRARSASHEARERLLREALLVPCLFAPLAVLSPWAGNQGFFGLGLGNLPFFLSWLDRYPTVGSINHEVLLGIGALLGASAMPSFFAVYVSQARRPALGPVLFFCVLQLIAYVPVLFELDRTLLVALTVPELGWFGVMIGSGALLRLLATASMLAFIPVALRARRAPPVVWETDF